MAIVRIMDESDAVGKVKVLFEEIKATLQLPFVPELFRALAPKPERLESVWAQVKGLYGSGCLDPKTKLFAALAVAAVQGNSYFVKIHSIALKRLGASDEELSELLQVAGLSAALDTLVSGLDLEPEL